MDINVEKNILFVTNLHLWSLEKGKGGRAFYNTVEGYKKAGWNIWFVTTGGGVPDGLIEESQLFERSFRRLDRLWRSKFRLISIFARYTKLLCLNQYYYQQGSEILRLNSDKRFVIYAYEVDSVAACKKLARKFNFPLVTRFQGTKHNKTTNNIINKIKKAPHLQAMGANADIVIMTNDGTQGLKTLQRLNNKSKKILFWRNGVTKVPAETLELKEQFRREFNFRKDTLVFLTVSRLVNWKKVDRAINAFASVTKSHNNCKLVILGDGEARSSLEILAKNLNISEKVTFTGAVQQSSVSKYMVAADFFLSFYDLSNVGNPLMEAMMCGKPIITLDVGDTCELIRDGENGILLSPSELDKIPSFMEKLIEDKDFTKHISKGALRTAHEQFWNWEERISAEIKEVSNLVTK